MSAAPAVTGSIPVSTTKLKRMGMMTEDEAKFARIMKIVDNVPDYLKDDLSTLSDTLDRLLALSKNMDILIGKKAITDEEKERIGDMMFSEDIENLTMAETIVRFKLNQIQP